MIDAQKVPVTTLSRLSPLEYLGTDSLAQAAELARQETLPRGTQLVDFPWSMRVAYLLKGELKLAYPGDCIKVQVGGCGSKILPLDRKGTVPLAATSITDCEMLWFEENALDILMTWDGALRQDTAPASGDKRQWGNALPGILDAHKLTRGIFASLPPAHIESLLQCFVRMPAKSGDVILQQGAPGDYYYVIERGRARVVREVGGAQIELAQLKAGDAFGEEALIAGSNRNASVTMLTDGELLRLDGADFSRLLREPLLHSIDADEAVRRVSVGGLWLDVRFPAEYRQDGLPGAMNIPLNELRDALPGLPKDQQYIVYCQTGRRSSAAAFLMSQRGFDASLLRGGLKTIGAMNKVTE